MENCTIKRWPIRMPMVAINIVYICGLTRSQFTGRRWDFFQVRNTVVLRFLHIVSNSVLQRVDRFPTFQNFALNWYMNTIYKYGFSLKFVWMTKTKLCGPYHVGIHDDFLFGCECNYFLFCAIFYLFFIASEHTYSRLCYEAYSLMCYIRSI